jgi:hypothetical protein
MHAVVVHATIAPGQMDAARTALHDQVLPRVRQAPGLVKGYWTRNADGTNGISVVVFNSQSDAENAAGMVRSTPPPPGVTLGTIEVREVIAET